MKTIKDENGVRVQVFSPTTGRLLATSETPTKNEVVKLAADVTITLNAIAVPYLAGDIVGLNQGVTYTLSLATNAHVM